MQCLKNTKAELKHYPFNMTILKNGNNSSKGETVTLS